MINMKKLLLLFTFLGLVSCSSCLKKDQVPNNPTQLDGGSDTVSDASTAPDAVPTYFKVADSNWEFKLPNNTWNQINSDVDLHFVFSGYDNVVGKLLVIFQKEEFAGTTQNYTLFSIRGMRESGATLVSSSQVIINGNNFIQIEFVHDSYRVFQLIMVKRDFGYSLSCGGLGSSETQKQVCDPIFNSLIIN